MNYQPPSAASNTPAAATASAPATPARRSSGRTPKPTPKAKLSSTAKANTSVRRSRRRSIVPKTTPAAAASSTPARRKRSASDKAKSTVKRRKLQRSGGRSATKAKANSTAKGAIIADYYEIEKVVDYRVVKGRDQFLVYWVGFPESERTWVDEAQLADGPALVDAMMLKAKMLLPSDDQPSDEQKTESVETATAPAVASAPVAASLGDSPPSAEQKSESVTAVAAAAPAAASSDDLPSQPSAEQKTVSVETVAASAAVETSSGNRSTCRLPSSDEQKTESVEAAVAATASSDDRLFEQKAESMETVAAAVAAPVAESSDDHSPFCHQPSSAEKKTVSVETVPAAAKEHKTESLLGDHPTSDQNTESIMTDAAPAAASSGDHSIQPSSEKKMETVETVAAPVAASSGDEFSCHQIVHAAGEVIEWGASFAPPADGIGVATKARVGTQNDLTFDNESPLSSDYIAALAGVVGQGNEHGLMAAGAAAEVSNRINFDSSRAADIYLQHLNKTSPNATETYHQSQFATGGGGGGSSSGSRKRSTNDDIPDDPDGFFQYLDDNVANLPKTDGVGIDDIDVSPINFGKGVWPPPSPTLTEIAQVSDTKPSPPLQGSPLKDGGSDCQLKIEDEAVVSSMSGPVAKCGKDTEWADAEKSNLAWNHFSWSDSEGTPSPPQRTPTAPSWGKMVAQKERGLQSTFHRWKPQSPASSSTDDSESPTDAAGAGAPSAAAAASESTPGGHGDKFSSLLDSVVDAWTPPPRRATRSCSSQKK